MAYADSDQVTAVKIMIAGGFGVGKTTCVAALSEIRPLTTEAAMTAVGEEIDDLSAVADKTATTVAFDFGRITLDPDLVVYLFGTPGQERFSFLWEQISQGAIGAIILVDTRRFDACFDAVSFFESRGIPFIIAVNTFSGSPVYPAADLLDALDLDPATCQVVYCDARRREDVRDTLVALVEYVLDAGPRPRQAMTT